jgi:hypothetical protein
MRGSIFSQEFQKLFPKEAGTYLWSDGAECGCCLGHVLHQAHGVSYKSMRGVCSPDELAENLDRKNPLVTRDTNSDHVNFVCLDFVDEAMKLNDRSMNNKEREKQLKKLFKENGYEVKFV